MKTIAVAALMLLASASALPALSEKEARQQRIVVDIILGIINDWKQDMRDRGLDPLIVESARRDFALSEPKILSGSAWVENFELVGLTDIRVNNMHFSILSQTLTFDVSLGRLSARAGDAGFELTTFGRDISGGISGSLEIVNARVTGSVRVSVGVISGISIRNISLRFSVGAINSDLNVIVLGRDISDRVNDYLNNILPAALKESEREINNLLEYIALIIAERLLNVAALNAVLRA
ncbi:uncharacterized protein [Battus philenor]|uniref:uncharacterized protein n=1 Tax=Battus philenor TaxID=42288 RepID=UPI0035CF4C34